MCAPVKGRLVLGVSKSVILGVEVIGSASVCVIVGVSHKELAGVTCVVGKVVVKGQGGRVW